MQHKPTQDKSITYKSAFFAVMVHLVLFTALLISFNWKAAHSVVSVSEVELWDQIPAKNTVITPPPPEAKPQPPVKPPPEPEVKPEPAKPIEAEKPAPEEPKVDIALEKKKQALLDQQKLDQQKLEKIKLEKQKKLEEKLKKAAELEKIQQALRDEALQEKPLPKKPDNEALKKMQQEMANEDAGQTAQQASAASSATVNEFVAKIQAKVKGNVNKSLCGDGKPELTFKISVLPTGELSGEPILAKSSGNSVCNDAVERAIIASEPLPLPTEPAALAKFRNMNLIFKPNE